MRRLLFQGWHRTKTLSRAQKLRAWAYRLEGVANALTCVLFAGCLMTLWFSRQTLRETNEARGEQRIVESSEVWKARQGLPTPLKEEWERQKARVRTLEAERQGFQMRVTVFNVIVAFGQLFGLMLAKWCHDRADRAEGLGPYAMEEPAKLLRPASHVDEPESE